MLSEMKQVKQLTPDLLNMLIDHIDVHDTEVINGKVVQKIDIHYKYADILGEVKFYATRFYRSADVAFASRQRNAG